MGISQLIAEQKQKFRQKQISYEKKRIIAETERLKHEREHQAELAKVNAYRVEAMEALEYAKRFNDKHPTPPSKIQSFGKGLAAVMNKGREGIKQAKKEGHFRGIDYGGNSRPSPFSLGSQQPVTKEQVKPKKVVTKFY